MVRHGDPGVPTWLTTSEEVSPRDLSREIDFTTEFSETQIVTYTVNHSVTLQDLVDDGYLIEGDDHDRDTVEEAISDYVGDGNVDQFDDNNPDYGDGEYYDSSHYIRSHNDQLGSN